MIEGLRIRVENVYGREYGVQGLGFRDWSFGVGVHYVDRSGFRVLGVPRFTRFTGWGTRLTGFY